MKNETLNLQNESSLRVAVVGLGYVGCVTAACLANIGHTVTGIDKDAHKVDSINRRRAPFYEPGLDELLRDEGTSSRLTATRSMAEGLEDAEVALLCVGTPSQASGDISLEHLQRVCLEIAALLPARSKPLIVAVRSTVFPGSCESLLIDVLDRSPLVRIVCNPEFLREGSAVQDFLVPSLLVVGGDDPEAVAVVSSMYASLPIRPSLVGLRTAEIIKYACNAFHAVKIGFANEIGTLATQFGVDCEEVMHTLCQDGKLNISSAYLKPGFAFGGSCLPKDLRAIVYRGRRSDLSLPLLEAVLPSNERHLQRAIGIAQSLPAERIGVFGLAFKENTDDLRESPVVTLLEQLLAKGKSLRVYDPHIQLDSIYGSNLNFLLSALPHIGRLLVPNLRELVSWSDQLIVAQKPSPKDDESIRLAGVEILDLTRIPTHLEPHLTFSL
jgi:GDP-mannose 6-dehydrogenase